MPPTSDKTPSTALFLRVLHQPHTWNELRDAVPLSYRRLRELVELHLDNGSITVLADGRFIVAVAAQSLSEGGAR